MISSMTPDEQAGVNHAVLVMKGEIPAVMINGRGKANPTADEVASEYAHE
jgi:hypothetical protein